ncbi:MAG: aminotransferase class I/II-fold pyridoxal phosphate-dependent enzyme, partial [Sciscionella sp.]|nr:aminotransferase class I/II-fold pyridoxal phosphate-dependent enzyme [Sciscionella sp.]
MTTRLGDFPWDALTEYKATAGAHPAGLVDLSVGAPVDPVPDSIQRALNSAAHLSGYPATHGTPGLREAAAAALRRRFDVTVDPAAVLPTIGSKELIAWLPTLLGLGPGDTVVIPELAYPTYQVGARLAGARVLRSDGLLALGPEKPAL